MQGRRRPFRGAGMLNGHSSLSSRRKMASGVSIVELLVGIAVGLIVVAAASMTVATQLSDNRRLLLEAQVQQDLRAATDIITRELRRTGFWYDAQNQVWAQNVPLPADLSNPRSTLTPPSGTTGKLEYQYDRGVGATANFKFGFCWGSDCSTASTGMIRSKLAPGAVDPQWHALTDEKAVNITSMTLTPVLGPATKVACPMLCAGGGTACWPQVAVREVEIAITGQAVSDAAVVRTLTSRVRLRNDQVTLQVPGAAVGSLVACPAL